MWATASGSSSQIYYIVGIAAAVVAVVIAFGTAPGRALLSKMFRGQSVEKMAATFGDQMAGAHAAYQICEAERTRLEQIIATKENEIGSLRAQMSTLSEIVTSKAEVRELATLVSSRHAELMEAIHSVATIDQIKEALREAGS